MGTNVNEPVNLLLLWVNQAYRVLGLSWLQNQGAFLRCPVPSSSEPMLPP